MSSKEIENGELRVESIRDNKFSTDDLYKNIKSRLEEARAKAYSAVNIYMVKAYWEIGKIIYDAQGGNDRSEYGKELINELSKKLTSEYGKGFDKSNISRMRKFYVLFNNVDAVRQELSWTHYRLLLKVEDSKKREFYINECIKSNWSTRQLERQINSFYYERLLSTQERYKDEVRNEIKELEPSKNINYKENDFILDVNDKIAIIKTIIKYTRHKNIILSKNALKLFI